MGTLQGIWLKRAKRGPMDSVRSASLEPGVGLLENANKGGRRQVTIIARERWAELWRFLASSWIHRSAVPICSCPDSSCGGRADAF